MIGYDETMKTYFFQTGKENENSEPLTCLGLRPNEFQRVNDIQRILSNNHLVLKIRRKDKKALRQYVNDIIFIRDRFDRDASPVEANVLFSSFKFVK